MNNQAAQTMPSNIVERLASAKDKLPAGSDERMAVWRAIEYFRAISQTAGVVHLRTGVPDKDGREICVGDRIVYRNASQYTKEEYWNPEYVVEWKAPSFVLRHVGGGKNDSNASFAFNVAVRDPHWAIKLETIAAALAASGGEDDDDEAPKPTAMQIRYAEGYSDGVRDTERIAKERESSAASVSERARELLATELRGIGYPSSAAALAAGADTEELNVLNAALRALEQALTQQRGECEDARKFHRLAQLLDGFDFRLGRNALMPPATYLDSVEITCEFQPGIGQSVIDAIVDVLATEKRND